MERKEPAFVPRNINRAANLVDKRGVSGRFLRKVKMKETSSEEGRLDRYAGKVRGNLLCYEDTREGEASP